MIKTLLTENKDLQGEIDEQKKQIDELKQSASSAEVTNSSEDSTSDSASGTTTNTDEGFVDLVYDGDNYEVYTLDNDNGSFKIAGQEYHSGITIGSGKGFILTNLGKKYTHVSLEIGRVDESSIQNGTMLVIRDGKETNSYSLDAEKTLEQIDFDVTGTNNLKIQVDTDWSNYGIVNIKLK